MYNEHFHRVNSHSYSVFQQITHFEWNGQDSIVLNTNGNWEGHFTSLFFFFSLHSFTSWNTFLIPKGISKVKTNWHSSKGFLHARYKKAQLLTTPRDHSVPVFRQTFRNMPWSNESGMATSMIGFLAYLNVTKECKWICCYSMSYLKSTILHHDTGGHKRERRRAICPFQDFQLTKFPFSLMIFLKKKCKINFS